MVYFKRKKRTKVLRNSPRNTAREVRVFERLRSAPNRNINENRGLWKTCEEIIAMKFPNLKKKKRYFFRLHIKQHKWDIVGNRADKFPLLSSLWIALTFDFFLKIWRSSGCWANTPVKRLLSLFVAHCEAVASMATCHIALFPIFSCLISPISSSLPSWTCSSQLNFRLYFVEKVFYESNNSSSHFTRVLGIFSFSPLCPLPREPVELQ